MAELNRNEGCLREGRMLYSFDFRNELSKDRNPAVSVLEGEESREAVA